MSTDPSLQTLETFFSWCAETAHEDKDTPALLRNLHHDKIPTGPGHSADSIQVIKVALRSLVSLERLDGSRAEISKMIQEAWSDHLWGWLEFLHTHCVIEQSLGETLMLVSLRLIPRILGHLTWHLGLRESVIRTPGCLDILLRHWVEEETYVKKPQMAWGMRYFALALDKLLCYSEGDDDEVLVIIGDAIEGGRDAVARIALNQLSAQLKDGNDRMIVFDVISFNLTVIDFFVSGSSSATLRSLLCQGLMVTIARFLNTLDRTTFATDNESLQSCIIAALSIVSTVLFSANGHSWISQCIDAGLISGVLCSERWLHALGPIFPSRISGTVFGYLQPYLVYRSVLRTIGKALEDVKRIQDGRDVSGPMWKIFFSFQKAASRRLAVKAMFDKDIQSGLEPGFTGCDNRLCLTTTDNVEFKRCAACLNALYCGRSCQKVDWSQHRAACKKLQKALAQGDYIPLSIHDKSFLHYLSAADFRSGAPLVMDDIRQNHASTPLSSLYVNLDYTRVHYQLTVHPLSSYPSTDEDERLRVRDILHSLDERQIVVRVAFRAGDIFRYFPMSLSIPADMH